MLELITFVIMAGGAYISLVTKQRAVVYGWFVIFVVYSLIVRLLPPMLDMVGYTSAITKWPPALTVYTLREPVIWLGAPLLHKIIGNSVLTFLIFDVASGAIVIRAMKGFDSGDGRMVSLAPTIIVSYVFLLGQQNAWRQQVAFVIFLWSCAARSHCQPQAFVLFTVSVLAHNSTALLLGYWFDLGRMGSRRYGPLITIVGITLILLPLPYLGKSSSGTGLNTEGLYVALAMALALLMLFAASGRLPHSIAAGLYNFAAFTPAIGILGSSQFERMGMMFLVLMLIDMCRNYRPLRLRETDVLHLVYVILVGPVFIFPNALRMLLM